MLTSLRFFAITHTQSLPNESNEISSAFVPKLGQETEDCHQESDSVDAMRK